ncbi:MAG: Cyclic pyranopterin monophosphate synthase accessory protein 2 [bacterium ADurb.Bin429]|nr:MAG: Cyclic pyranopterin monophosphate synthase accessory protein 2 [bacterium ADurb.Bin429]
MRDITHKTLTARSAVAEATLRVSPATMACIHRQAVPKGDPLPVARMAAIQAAKQTSLLIPYCHPVPLDFVGVEFALTETMIQVTASVKAVYKTGVEMEALTAASVAALTLYDMLKMLDEEMEIIGVRLIEKRGGQTEYMESFTLPVRAAVLVMSDTIAAGEKEDYSGRLIAERLQAEGVEVADYRIIPDDPAMITATLCAYADIEHYDLVLTTGGTGFSSRDNTPEAMNAVITRDIPGIPEALRAYGQSRTPYAMLSRGRAGLRHNTLIINLPGSKRGVAESLDALFPGLLHAFHLIRGNTAHDRKRSGRKRSKA